jgi:hypothetical protein
LRFWHPTIDPAAISAELGIQPSRTWKVGEPRSTPSGRLLKGGPRSESYWIASISAGRQTDAPLRDAISTALDELTRHKDLFYRIRAEGGKVEFFIGWHFEGQSGDTFDYNLLGRLDELQIDLALDVYGLALVDVVEST